MIVLNDIPKRKSAIAVFAQVSQGGSRKVTKSWDVLGGHRACKGLEHRI